VPLHVEREVVGPAELPGAQVAFERLLACGGINAGVSRGNGSKWSLDNGLGKILATVCVLHRFTFIQKQFSVCR
jgi:hypothetical protein